MKLARMPYEPGALVDFYEEGLGALGAVCARTWHDRLTVLAEGAGARLWRPDGELHEVELHFAAAGGSEARDAAREVFPGCPLTFALAEALRPPLAVERAVLAADAAAARAPDAAVAERLWRSQFPDTKRWRRQAPFVRDHHFSLVALARGEIQAIDQQWTMHRIALALPDGRIDDGLAREMGFARIETESAGPAAWPGVEVERWTALLGEAIEQELAAELAAARARQEARLRRELGRVDDYFDNYERELTERARRGGKVKLAERLAAAKADHARHRADQAARHEIALVPHIDAVLLVAEPAWRAALHIEKAHHAPTQVAARFVPRARRWEVVAE